jgi:tRNA threonylcarbamoyladenosine biosynthesis protein TsaE
MQLHNHQLVIETCSPDHTEMLGAQLGELLIPGDIVPLRGELGGGKTCFVRGIVAATTPESLNMVASPTFAILNEYPGSLPVFHYDCYRLRGCDDAIDLGLEEHLYGNGICLIEWPDRIADMLPENRLEIQFEYCGDTQRRITFLPYGDHASSQVNSLADS